MPYFVVINLPEENTFRMNGPYASEYRANLAAESLDRDYEVKYYPTSNLGRAIGMEKEQRMGNLGVESADKRAKRGF